MKRMHTHVGVEKIDDSIKLYSALLCAEPVKTKDGYAKWMLDDPALGQDRYQAQSAGSKPAGYVHPKSIETLNRHGIPADNPHSKSWDAFEGEHFHLVISVCDQAGSESCPVSFGKHEKLHWSTPDPAKPQDSNDEVNAAFDHAYTMLKNRIEKELL